MTENKSTICGSQESQYDTTLVIQEEYGEVMSVVVVVVVVFLSEIAFRLCTQVASEKQTFMRAWQATASVATASTAKSVVGWVEDKDELRGHSRGYANSGA